MTTKATKSKLTPSEQTTQQFCIIALKPLKKCNPAFLKVLREEETYFFHQDYTISLKNGRERITHEPTLPEGLFDVGKIAVSICAIVGKNGAGKSSLIELLYAGLYNLSLQLNVIEDQDDEGRSYDIIRRICFDLYVMIGGRVGKIRFVEHLVTFYWAEEKTGVLVKDKTILTARALERLFYSISVNYSLYGLNTEEMGHWLKAIFHKNDGYQTPIVITPFRKKGNIDINRENDLVRTRLLSIIVQGADYNGNAAPLINNKIPQTFYFSIDARKFGADERDVNLYRIRSLSSWELDTYGSLILPIVYEVFLDDTDFEPDDNLLNRLSKQYIVKKIITIASRYQPYRDRYKSLAVSFQPPRKNDDELSIQAIDNVDEDQLFDLITDLAADKSHIALKLGQAICFLRYNILPKDKLAFETPVKGLVSAIRLIERYNLVPYLKEKTNRIQYLIPPSFLWYNIEFEEVTKRFDSLSSGEKQRIYSFASIVYHLRNLDSVLSNSDFIPDVRPLNKYRLVVTPRPTPSCTRLEAGSSFGA